MVKVCVILSAFAACCRVAQSHGGDWDGRSFMNEDGLPLPALSGIWLPEEGGRLTSRPIALQIYHPPLRAARPTNSSYSLRLEGSTEAVGSCYLSPLYAYHSRIRSSTQIQCEPLSQSSDSMPVEAVIGLANDRTIIWSSGARWQRQHTFSAEEKRYVKVHKVHVVFANHYDVGYTGFINKVDNVYLHGHYPAAQRLANATRSKGGPDKYIYMTHPWMTQRFLECRQCADSAECPIRTLNNNMTEALKCPSDEEVANLKAVASVGGFVWNAAPFNLQPENMAPELLDAGLRQARDLTVSIGGTPGKTASIRDVVYVTRSLLPRLQAAGIQMLTIGSNPACVPPALPKLHRWRDESTGAEMVVAYHPFGYGGYGLNDCAVAPNGVALCTDFRVDNSAPPKSPQDFENILTKIRKEYPGARVVSSSFDHFADDIMDVKDQLPLVNLEVGDTWIYGVPSDPLKIAQHRAMQRAWIQCMRGGDPRCSLSNPVIRNFTFYLQKAPEHTWGLPGVSGWGGGDDYNVSRFRKNLTMPAFMAVAASWAEQRFFNELAVLALEEADHPLAPKIREELELVENVSAPSLANFKNVSLSAEVKTRGPNGITLRFGPDASIARLSANGAEWASPESPLGALVYQTFTDTEWKPFTYAYMNDHQMQGGFCKNGSDPYSESTLWHPELSELWVAGSVEAADNIIAVMDFPERAATEYGSPKRAYLQVTPTLEGIDLSLTTLDKMPTMIGEALMFVFRPALELQRRDGGSAWRMSKLGLDIDPEGVVKGGNQFVHAVWGGVTVSTKAGTMSLEALDSAAMSPVTSDFPIGNPLPASYKEADAKAGKGLDPLAAGSVVGMAANLHNNLWNTNYPLFYPYFDPKYCESPTLCRNRDALYRFHLRFAPVNSSTIVV